MHILCVLFECMTDFTVALRAQNIAVDEDTEYSFPSQQEIMQLTLPNSALADISLSSAILAESTAGMISTVMIAGFAPLLRYNILTRTCGF